MDIARDPTREGEEDAEAVLAYDRSCGLFPFQILRWMVLHRLARFNPQGTLLDAGCGPGQLALAIANKFRGVRVTGLDNNADMIAAALRNRSRSSAGGVDFRLGDVHQIPFADGYFDFIVSTLSLHHWEDARRAFAEIFRVLKPGGRLLLMDLRRDSPGWWYYLLVLMQRFAVPAAIKRTNGAVGSFYASYTAAELGEMLGSIPFQEVVMDPAPGWMFALAQKGPRISLSA
jgi:ubiquinone/menaquinone biosynthesis C-methylase UbiE